MCSAHTATRRDRINASIKLRSMEAVSPVRTPIFGAMELARDRSSPKETEGPSEQRKPQRSRFRRFQLQVRYNLAYHSSSQSSPSLSWKQILLAFMASARANRPPKCYMRARDCKMWDARERTPLLRKLMEKLGWSYGTRNCGRHCWDSARRATQEEQMKHRWRLSFDGVVEFPRVLR